MTDVRTFDLPEMTCASLRRVIPTYADEGVLWEELWPLLVASGAAFPADGIAGATFHDGEYREADVEVEVWVQLTAPLDVGDPVVCRTEPARSVVGGTLYGDYSQMGEATSAVGRYVAEHGLNTGAMFNIYRVSPAQNPDPSSWVTEVCYPILP